MLASTNERENRATSKNYNRAFRDMSRKLIQFFIFIVQSLRRTHAKLLGLEWVGIF